MVLVPSILEIHWACLSLLILSSWMRDHSLFLASCLLPLPAWFILPRRHSTWAFIAANDSLLRSCPTISAFSWSLPPSGRPSASTWNLSLDSAMVSIKSWTSWLASPNAPKQRPFISPNSSNLCSTGPLSPDGTLLSPDQSFWLFSCSLHSNLWLFFQLL